MTASAILVPTDFSRDAKAALHYASLLAVALKKPLVLLHVKPASILPHAEDDVADPAEAFEHHQLGALHPENASIPCQRLFRRGNPPDEILAFVHDNPVECIVLGSHGLTNSPQQPIGSIAAAVIRESRTPVICVKSPA
mgnify:CR=1 FL=1